MAGILRVSLAILAAVLLSSCAFRSPCVCYYYPGRLVGALEPDGTKIDQQAPVEYLAPAEYPEVARLSEMTGNVVVKIRVTGSGTVVEAQVLKGIHTLLDREALRAARRSKFGRPSTGRIEDWWSIVEYWFGETTDDQ